MRSHRSLASAALCAAIVTALVACSSPTRPDAGSPDSDAASPPQGQVVAQGSMVKAYLTAEELAADSTLLVLGEVVGASPVKIYDLTFTRYVLKVDTALSGTAGSEIAVYLVGEPGWQVSVDGPAYLKEGERYILFVQPTGLPADQPGGNGYYIVGPGVWTESGDSGFDIWLDPTKNFELGDIPTTFTLADAAAVLSADRVGTAR